MSPQVRVRPWGINFFATASVVTLVIYAVVAGFGMLASANDLISLRALKSGIEVSGSAIDSLFVLHDALHGLRVIALWLCAIPVVAWIYQANVGARALGATGISFSPFASVIWFVVPVAYLWMPYRAVSQVWRASHDPEGWREARVPNHVRWWWGLWVLLNLSNRALRSLATNLEGIDSYIQFGYLSQVNNLVALLASVLLIVLIRRLARKQEEEYRRFDFEGQVVVGASGTPQSVFASKATW